MSFWSSWFGSGGDKRKIGTQIPIPHSSSNTSSPVTFDSAMQVSAFWASVRLLTEVIAAMPIRCYNINQETKIKTINTQYDLWRLINYKPNRYQTRTEFIESIGLGLFTNGNAYTAIERNGQGKIISLMPLISSQMEVKLSDDGAITYCYTTADNNIKIFSEKSIWHVKLFGNGVVGLSPLGYARNALGIAQSLESRVSTLAKNGGKTSGILTIDKTLNDSQRDTIRKEFKQLSEGSSDQLFVLEGDMKYQQTSLSPSDMQMIENRRFQIEDIARFMGVPSVLINDTSATTAWGSGIEQINEGFYKLNLRTHLERIESSIKRHLMVEFDWDSIEIEFDFDSLLRADKVKRTESQAKAVNAGLLTPNEGRASEGLEPKTGGETIYLNGTLVPAGTNNGNQITQPR